MIIKNQPDTQLLTRIKKQVVELLNFFLNFETDLDLQHKLKIYNYIAEFIKDKIDTYNNDFNTCLSAVYFLCGETDQKLLLEDTPSIKTQKLISIIKEQLIAVKVHYQKDKETKLCSQKTEIFALLIGKDKPTLKKIEESEIYLDDLPQEIANIFIEEQQASVSFQIYP